MRRRSRGKEGPKVEAVRRRIETWRRTRTKLSPMPEELWSAAVELAGKDGVGPTSRALGIDYGALRRRSERDVRTRKTSEESPAGFLELTPNAFSRLNRDEVVVEVSDAFGAKLAMRLPRASEPDIAALLAAFLGRTG